MPSWKKHCKVKILKWYMLQLFFLCLRNFEKLFRLYLAFQKFVQKTLHGQTRVFFEVIQAHQNYLNEICKRSFLVGNRLILNQLRFMLRLIHDFCSQVERIFTSDEAYRKCNILLLFTQL